MVINQLGTEASMSVRKRTWITAGETKESWICDYVSGSKRHIRTFARKKDADAFETTMRTEVQTGVHTPDRESITVAKAGLQWLQACDQDGLERSTTDEYKRHLELHIVPRLGHVKLSRLTAPAVRAFTDKLQVDGMSAAMIRKVRTSLGSLVADALEQGQVAQNVVRQGRRKKRGAAAQVRGRRLKVGVDLPSPAEVKALLGASQGRTWAFLATAVFTGLRASELRGLRWSDVDFKKRELHVRQRADRYSAIGAPKSAAGERTVPLPKDLLQPLQKWKLACPKGNLYLVFPNGAGRIESHANLINRVLVPAMIAAGVARVRKDSNGRVVHDEAGKPIRESKYTGLHALRHFYASWCINRKADGGLELPPKTVQTRLGHATIAMTLDRYGHLFERGDDTAELDTAATALLADATQT
jgi:integrase